MGVPVFEQVEVVYPNDGSSVGPGGAVTVTVTVTDPDSETIKLTITLTTAAGVVTELASKAFQRSDLTVEAALREMDYEAGWGLERSTDHPGRWVVTAPG
jgi:hypothetical protein